MNDTLKAIQNKAISFLSDLKINVTNHYHTIIEAQDITLKDLCVRISTSEYLHSTIIISYQDDILNKITEQFIDCNKLSKEEKEKIKQSASCEFANVIVGNALECPSKNDLIDITPPAIIDNKQSIFKNKKIFISTIQTQNGNIFIYFDTLP